MTKPKRPRKPKDYEGEYIPYAGIEQKKFASADGNRIFLGVNVDVSHLSTEEARRLAEWLVRAADFVERKER